MNLLLDTNILIEIVRNHEAKKLLRFINPNDDLIYLSIVSVGEIRTIAIANNWGDKRLDYLENFIDNIRVIDVTDFLIEHYMQIDLFSQRKLPFQTNYPFDTPRNMGKNDLWIAATASFLNLKLVTTDTDFDHLNNEFIKLNRVSPENIVKYIRS